MCFDLPPLYITLLSFSFNPTSTTEIYTLSLHDALPILRDPRKNAGVGDLVAVQMQDRQNRPVANRVQELVGMPRRGQRADRKSTRLNSSHRCISYAVFCLKKKKTNKKLVSRSYTSNQTS